MSNRGMSAAMLAEIAKQKISVFHLVELHFSSVQYIATAHRTVVWGGNTYSAAGNLLSIDDVQESARLQSNAVTIQISGVNQTNIAAALGENYIDARAVIYRGFFDASDTVVVDPIIIFDGNIDSYDLKEDIGSGTAVLSWTAASHWVDFERKAGRRTNNASQQIYYPGDTGFEFAADSPSFKWGKG